MDGLLVGVRVWVNTGAGVQYGVIHTLEISPAFVTPTCSVEIVFEGGHVLATTVAVRGTTWDLLPDWKREEIDTLQCLRKHGERLDSQIAHEMGVPVGAVRDCLMRLAAAGEIITCNLTRFERGNRVEALLCRVAGYIPPKAPGRKPNPLT